jgi:hypothetical protein
MKIISGSCSPVPLNKKGVPNRDALFHRIIFITRQAIVDPVCQSGRAPRQAPQVERQYPSSWD